MHSSAIEWHWVQQLYAVIHAWEVFSQRNRSVLGNIFAPTRLRKLLRKSSIPICKEANRCRETNKSDELQFSYVILWRYSTLKINLVNHHREYPKCRLHRWDWTCIVLFHWVESHRWGIRYVACSQNTKHQLL